MGKCTDFGGGKHMCPIYAVVYVCILHMNAVLSSLVLDAVNFYCILNFPIEKFHN